MGEFGTEKEQLVPTETLDPQPQLPGENAESGTQLASPARIFSRDSQETRRLSTFFGVVVPCILSMFSVILFLRIGFIVGQAGLIQSLLILFLAYIIIGLTVLSVCAISTNGAIEGGGAYFMISRALGPEFGGAIGLMFFLANVAAAALYVFGIVEAMGAYFGPHGELMADLLPVGKWYDFGYGSAVLFFCFIVCLVGANIYAKATFLIFLLVMTCIVSVIVSFFTKKPFMMSFNQSSVLDRCNHTSVLYTGFNRTTLDGNIPAHYGFDYTRNRRSDFQHSFAVFFTSKHALLTVCTLIMERSVANANYTVDYTTGTSQHFVLVFSVFFNGCTGINAGTNMSGELKNPSKAIPTGTIIACVITWFIYLILILFVAGSTPRDILQCSYTFLVSINVWPPFVVIGIFASSLSAALSSIIGASRILLALAKDELFGIILRPVTKTTKGGNPYIAVFITWILVQILLFAQNVNTIAPVVTIFFLFAYAAVDMSCLALEWASAPNFRPTFKYFSWHTCLIGILSCVTMMFLIEPIYTLVSTIALIILVVVIYYQVPTSSWGYISQALIFHQVRKYLLMLDVRKEHVKFWRPQILLMVKNPRSCCQMIDFINSIKKSGLYVLGHVSHGKLADMPSDILQAQYHHWTNLVQELGVKAFIELTLCSSVREGTEHLLRLSGLGGMKPNTLVLGFYDDCPQQNSFEKLKLFIPKDEPLQDSSPPSDRSLNVSIPHSSSENNFPVVDETQTPSDVLVNKRLPAQEYVEIIVDAIKLKKNVCLGRYFWKLDKSSIVERRQGGEVVYIDVWPVNFLYPVSTKYQTRSESKFPEPEFPRPFDIDIPCGLPDSETSHFDVTGVFLMQMGCILNMTQFWKKNAKLRINICADLNYEAEGPDQQLKDFLKTVRIKAEVRRVPCEYAKLLQSSIKNASHAGVEPNISAASPGVQNSDVFLSEKSTSEPTQDLHANYRPSIGDDDESVNQYLKSVNSLLKSNSENSAVSFLYLPAPPTDEAMYLEYLRMLTVVSEGLGPTLYAHGLSRVVSTAL